MVDDRPDVRLDADADAHRFQRQHDVGEHHGPVDAELVDRHQRDLGAELRRLGELEDAVPLAERAIGSERSPGLAHEPDRGRVHGLVAAGANEPVVHDAASAKAIRAAASVASISARPCEIDGNHASNGDGGNRMPWSSIEPKKRTKAVSVGLERFGRVRRHGRAEEDGQQRPDLGHRGSTARGRRRIRQPAGETRRRLFQRGISRRGQVAQRGDPAAIDRGWPDSVPAW